VSREPEQSIPLPRHGTVSATTWEAVPFHSMRDASRSRAETGAELPEVPNNVVDRTRVASDSGDLRVYRSAQDSTGPDGFVAKALDTQTGERCRVYAEIG
jgi:hypothetical protein